MFGDEGTATHQVRVLLGQGLQLSEIDMMTLAQACEEGAIVSELTPYTDDETQETS